MNTPKSRRLEIWDAEGLPRNATLVLVDTDAPPAYHFGEFTSAACPSGCLMHPCRAGPGGKPCCIRRLSATFPRPCEELPFGCPFNRQDERWLQRSGVLIDARVVPNVTVSDACPSYKDIMNTQAEYRWLIWRDGSTPKHCPDGCKFASQCVRRLRASWPIDCTLLKYGCFDTKAELTTDENSMFHQVRDLTLALGAGGAFAALEPSEDCPTREDVMSTPDRGKANRWSLWDDPSCRDGCSLDRCNGGRTAPCCVRRLRVLNWSVPCLMRPAGCHGQHSGAYLVRDVGRAAAGWQWRWTGLFALLAVLLVMGVVEEAVLTALLGLVLTEGRRRAAVAAVLRLRRMIIAAALSVARLTSMPIIAHLLLAAALVQLLLHIHSSSLGSSALGGDATSDALSDVEDLSRRLDVPTIHALMRSADATAAPPAWLHRATKEDLAPKAGAYETYPSWSVEGAESKSGAGILFFAYGSTRTLHHFLLEAQLAATTFRADNPRIRIAIVTNNETVDRTAFDVHIKPRDDLLFGGDTDNFGQSRGDRLPRQWLTRLYYMAHSPFLITWALDSNVISCTPGAAHRFLRAALDRELWGYHVAHATQNLLSHAMYPHNFNIVYRWSQPAAALMRDWFLLSIRQGVANDDQKSLHLAELRLRREWGNTFLRVGQIAPRFGAAFQSLASFDSGRWGAHPNSTRTTPLLRGRVHVLHAAGAKDTSMCSTFNEHQNATRQVLVKRVGYAKPTKSGHRPSIMSYWTMRSRDDCDALLRPQDGRYCLLRDRRGSEPREPDDNPYVWPAEIESLSAYLNSSRCGLLCGAGVTSWPPE